MAERRMMTKKITNSARFIKMPTDSQALYTHLCMNADDDGVVEAYSILKLTGIREDNLRVLSAKEFIKVLNEDLVSYIMDWTEQNQIRPDRKINSVYKDLLVSILPDVELVEPTPRADVKNNNKRLGNGQSTDSPRTVHNNKNDKKKDVDSPRSAQYSVVECSLGENSIGENTLSDFSTKNADDKKDSLISEKNKIIISSENEVQQTSEVPELPASTKSKKVKNEIFSFSEKLEIMQNDKRRNIQIIALYWKFKKFIYTNQKQYESAIGRDVKAGSKLSGYSDEQITKTMQWLEKNAITYVWKLETVHKYIDEKGETPSETLNINSSEDQEAYLMNEGNPQYKTFDIPWNELSEDERNKFLENEAIRKKYKDAPFSPKEINFKEFAKDFSVKKTSTLTKEDIKKIPLIDF